MEWNGKSSLADFFENFILDLYDFNFTLFFLERKGTGG
jgi:hypothetical protein